MNPGIAGRAKGDIAGAIVISEVHPIRPHRAVVISRVWNAFKLILPRLPLPAHGTFPETGFRRHETDGCMVGVLAEALHGDGGSAVDKSTFRQGNAPSWYGDLIHSIFLN